LLEQIRQALIKTEGIQAIGAKSGIDEKEQVALNEIVVMMRLYETRIAAGQLITNDNEKNAVRQSGER